MKVSMYLLLREHAAAVSFVFGRRGVMAWEGARFNKWKPDAIFCQVPKLDYFPYLLIHAYK